MIALRGRIDVQRLKGTQATMTIIYFPGPEDNVPFTYTMPTWFVGALPPPYTSVDDPGQYLNFALEDCRSGDDRGLVNAVSNLKRALHLRIDMLLYQFGLLEYYREKGFSAKLKLIEDVGLLPTVMFRNINRERTFVEHEYVVPDAERVDEALDVIRLLYLASEPVLASLMSEAVVGRSRSPTHAILRVEPMHGELRFFEIEPMPDVRKTTTSGGEVEVISHYPRPMSKDEPEYTTADSPFEVVPLNNERKRYWLPIIKWIVKLSANKEFRSGKLTSVGGSDDYLVTTTVSFHVSVAQERGLTEASTKAMDRRIEMERKQKESEDSTTQTT